jgi:signal transduction histidine kinase
VNVARDADAAGNHSARWPWVFFAMFVVIAIVGMTLVVANDEAVGEQLPFVVAFSMFGVVGALVVSRERRNVIGSLFLYGSFIISLSFMAGELVTWLVLRGSRGLFAQAMGLLSSFGWLFGILPIVFLLPLLFPDGRLPSPRWRPFLWFIVAALAFMFVSLAFIDSELSGSTEDMTIPNPLYISALDGFGVPDAVFFFVYVGAFAMSLVSLLTRFRMASGIERQQIKWVAFGFLAAFLGTVLGGTISDPTVNAIVSGSGFLAFPVSVGIAVLRFHLYDLDVVVRKALVVGVLGVLIVLVYVTVVAGGTALLGRDDPTLSAVAAVALALAFQPARTQARRFADRLVYGKRATPYEVMAEFGVQLAGTYAGDDVLARTARVLGEGVGADRARVWLLVDDDLREVAAWPDGHGSGDRDDDLTIDVDHRGERLGALSLSMPPNDPMNPAKEKLVRDLAAQAGLVLRNEGLTSALKARLADLQAAQKRLVAAQDHERRRLERNIHDGAQQQLVALAVKARLARSLVERDPPKAEDMLDQIALETQAALEDLRDLARGIYPPLLADKGLAAALESQLRRSTVPATLHDEGVGRHAPQIEAAIYFACLEALANTAKHAEATQATVALSQTGGTLSFTVTDDGRGFDSSLTGYGTGLQGIADRLGAIDGELEIDSAPQRGTIIKGKIPVSDDEQIPSPKPQEVHA